MAVNHFFQGGNGIGNTNEQRLHEDLIIESLNLKIKISCLAFFVGPNVLTVQEKISTFHGPKKSKIKKILKSFL